MAGPVPSGEQLARLRESFQEYRDNKNYRANYLALRSRAHKVIRSLTAPERVPSLFLDDFDQHVWHSGNAGTAQGSFDWRYTDRIVTETTPERFEEMLDSGEFWFVGNMTWGSSSRTLRAYARGRPAREVEARMREALEWLLHRPGSIEERLRYVSDLAIGFGRNISSGLLMSWHPDEFVLYNSRSEDCWVAFGQDWRAGPNWVKPYLEYNAFCRALLDDPVLQFQNFVDLDVFVYWHTVRYPSTPEETRPKKTRAAPKSTPTKGGISLAQLETTRREMSPEKFRATWGALYDDMVAEELSRQTTEVTNAELGQRARRRVDEIHGFLQGTMASAPTSEVICDWIQFSYAMELYREAAALASHVHEGEIDPDSYRRARRIAEVSRRKLLG